MPTPAAQPDEAERQLGELVDIAAALVAVSVTLAERSLRGVPTRRPLLDLLFDHLAEALARLAALPVMKGVDLLPEGSPLRGELERRRR